ncbi:hypothetical protein LFML04_1343 [Leptospirillum ferriphilum ML-04]|uniref:Uncharacterized protein n=1 Tax=Leptospirillum ferriphilum (strain ML-04) TaxID=1048260 RepID=J9ZCH3_LEPFM|nr:hypothetical protein LFML04_1343 [Leptospirillum ferriphilum ML-04]
MKPGHTGRVCRVLFCHLCLLSLFFLDPEHHLSHAFVHPLSTKSRLMSGITIDIPLPEAPISPTGKLF